MEIEWPSIRKFVIYNPLSYFFCKLNWRISRAMEVFYISLWFSVIGEIVYIFGGWCPNTWKGFTTATFKDVLPVVKLSVTSGLWFNKFSSNVNMSFKPVEFLDKLHVLFHTTNVKCFQDLQNQNSSNCSKTCRVFYYFELIRALLRSSLDDTYNSTI